MFTTICTTIDALHLWIPLCDSLVLVTVGMEEAPLLQKLLRGMIEPIRDIFFITILLSSPGAP